MLEWEDVAKDTQRLKVPGGWLYKYYCGGYTSVRLLFIISE